MATVQSIRRQEIEEKLERGEKLVLVEALPPMYYEDMHLPGAINLPLDRLEELAYSLLPDRSAEIVTYCSNRACPNSEIAAVKLRLLGYTSVKEYREGKQDWFEAGLPVERSAAG
jgi:rhodanese-related sulfurtransferase